MDEQIKPVAWVHRQDAMFSDAGNWRYTNPILVATQESPELEPLYSQQTIDALRAEVEALREDAERYRWLRETRQGRAPGNRMNPAFVKIEFYHHAPGVIGDGPTLDAAIDAARKAAE